MYIMNLNTTFNLLKNLVLVQGLAGWITEEQSAVKQARMLVQVYDWSVITESTRPGGPGQGLELIVLEYSFQRLPVLIRQLFLDAKIIYGVLMVQLSIVVVVVVNLIFRDLISYPC